MLIKKGAHLDIIIGNKLNYSANTITAIKLALQEGHYLIVEVILDAYVAKNRIPCHISKLRQTVSHSPNDLVSLFPQKIHVADKKEAEIIPLHDFLSLFNGGK